nr:MAG TPA: capsid assembly protein [Caudoviricetes sp.]
MGRLRSPLFLWANQMALFNFWKSKEWRADNVKPAEDITQTTALEYGMSSAPISSLLGDANRPPRDRVQIYQKWEAMEGDPIVSSAVKLLVTGALGGHETSGDVVFIDDRPDLKEGEKNIVQEIREHCGPIINKVVYQMAYLGAIFGDSYSRIYVDGNGLVDLDCSEMVRPPLVQAYEQGSKTIGYSISVGKSLYERLTAEQMARLKMPRTQYVPQNTALHKAMRLKLSEDDINALPVMPALVGGSLLYPAEQPYWNLAAALLGIVGQRWIDSIDEQIIMPNMDSMTSEHRKQFMDGIKEMFQSSKANAEKAVKSGLPILERMRYLMPVFGDKQMITVAPLNGGNPGRAGQITIDDVMLHARMLAGALGVDLSMLGFADQMSGGLGEGGFFRTSAQAAEQARAIRQALTDWINHVLDVHCLHKYGVVYQNKLWDINFYGSISALEAEKQRTMVDKANYGGLLMQSMQMMKDMGADQQLMSVFLEKTMGLDEDVAKEFARIVDLKKVDDQEQERGGKW